jgi:hypothetical protein
MISNRRLTIPRFLVQSPQIQPSGISSAMNTEEDMYLKDIVGLVYQKAVWQFTTSNRKALNLPLLPEGYIYRGRIARFRMHGV